MSSGIFRGRKSHKVKGRHYMTFMVITDATKGAKTFRVPKILRFPILALIVFALIQGGLFYQHYVEMEENIATMNLERQMVCIENYNFQEILNERDEEVTLLKETRYKQLVSVLELATKLGIELDENEKYIETVDEKIEKIDGELGTEKDDDSAAVQSSETMVVVTAPTIRSIESLDIGIEADGFSAGFDAYALVSEDFIPNQGGVAYDTDFNYDNIDFDQELEALEIYLSKALDKVNVKEVEYEATIEELETMIPYVEAYPSVLPIEDTYITSPFGYRKNPFGYSSTEFHSGVDLKASYEPVYATGAGTVIEAKYLSGYGYTVIIDHGYGITTKYAHNSKLYVSVGDEVVRGDKISKSGNTGRSTGPHLHYEILVDGEPVDPLEFIYDKGEE